VSEHVVLTVRAPIERAIEADVIAPDRFASLDEKEIAALRVWDGRESRELGSVFDVRGGRAAAIRIEGNASRVDAIGAGMTGGELIVTGSVGRWAGTRMTGGVLRVEGSAGDGAGLEMAGGVLRIGGDAGDRVGASRLGASKGMLGGEIVVCGRAGAGVGTRMRRGTIVCGSVGAGAGEGMIAGNVVVLDAIGAEPGRWNKRGSIIALSEVTVPNTYRYDCTYRPPHLALMLRHLRDAFALAIGDDRIGGRWARYSGDFAELGKGEILAWQPTS
jgi:formylmethanofuran dehydrogenase subunit C